METARDILELASLLITTFGLPGAVIMFFYQRHQEQRAAEGHTFDQLDESYVSFLQLCLKNPDIDIFGRPLEGTYRPTADQLRREEAAFGILISMFERAHVMFRDHEHDFRQAQWDGWVKYMKSYCYRANFQREWVRVGSQFDQDFYLFMQGLVEAGPQAEAPPPPSIGQLPPEAEAPRAGA